jgi:hypothetical protein
VLTFLVKTVNSRGRRKEGKVVSLDVGSCDVTDFMLKELVTGRWLWLSVLKLDRNKLTGLCT